MYQARWDTGYGGPTASRQTRTDVVMSRTDFAAAAAAIDTKVRSGQYKVRAPPPRPLPGADPALAPAPASIELDLAFFGNNPSSQDSLNVRDVVVSSSSRNDYGVRTITYHMRIV